MEDIALFTLRLVVGALMIGHGAQKLFGWFGGYGLKGTGSWMESIGMKPGAALAALAGGAELGGGILLVLGWQLPVAAALLAPTMLVAAVKGHAGKGLWITNNGYEYVLVLGVVSLALAALGPGSIAV